MVGTVIRESLTAYRRLAVPVGVATLVVFAPFAVALLALELAVDSSPDSLQGLAVLDAVGSVLLFVPLASIIAIRCQQAVERQQPPRPAAEVAAALQLLPRYVLTQLLALLVIAGIPLALIAVGLAAGVQGLVLIGAGALIASALINGVRFGLAPVLAATGEAAYAGALRRSAGLVRGRFWSALGVLVVLSLIAFAIALVLSSIALAAPAGAGRAVLEAVIGLIANAIAVPLLAIGLYRLTRTLAEAAPAEPVSGA